MSNRKALVVGGTGLIGGHCLEALYADSNYSKVIGITRKPLLKTHRKLKEIVIGSNNLDLELSKIKVDDVFCCLGTTIKKAGTQEAVSFAWPLPYLFRGSGGAPDPLLLRNASASCECSVQYVSTVPSGVIRTMKACW